MFRARCELTALPSPASQRKALAYVLSQGVKEGLVERPEQWPGAHCAKQLAYAKPRRGFWFDGTAYGRALDRFRARVRGGKPPVRKDFERTTELHFDRLPALAHLSDADYQAYINTEIDNLVAAAADARKATGKTVLGRRKVCEISRMHRSELPLPPWFEKRRKMIIWDDPSCPEARAYLKRYWRFQDAFRRSSELYRSGILDAVFPPGAFRPPSLVLTAAA